MDRATLGIMLAPGLLDGLDVTDHYTGTQAKDRLLAAARDGLASSYTAAAATQGTPGALDPLQRIHYLAVDGTDGYTLADGTYVGQEVIVYCISGANTPNATVTPATTAGPAYTAVSAIGAAGDFIQFIWNGAGWLTGMSAGVTRA